jgi:predicted negative regulator of RcsB-dependent stress response
MGAYMFFSVILIIMVTLYFGWRVYKQKKYLSESWLKEHAPKDQEPKKNEVALMPPA